MVGIRFRPEDPFSEARYSLTAAPMQTDIEHPSRTPMVKRSLQTTYTHEKGMHHHLQYKETIPRASTDRRQEQPRIQAEPLTHRRHNLLQWRTSIQNNRNHRPINNECSHRDLFSSMYTIPSILRFGETRGQPIDKAVYTLGHRSRSLQYPSKKMNLSADDYLLKLQNHLLYSRRRPVFNCVSSMLLGIPTTKHISTGAVRQEPIDRNRCNIFLSSRLLWVEKINKKKNPAQSIILKTYIYIYKKLQFTRPKTSTAGN